MFSSLSSCTPSTSVTSSFTSTKSQDLLINQPVTVVGPNLYFLTSTVAGISVTSRTGGSTAINPELKLIRGISYKFHVNSINEPIYLTTTNNVEYSTGLRYVFDKVTEIFSGKGGVSSSHTFYGGTIKKINISSTFDAAFYSVWAQPFGAPSPTLMQPGVDYTTSWTGTTASFTFTNILNYVTIFLRPGLYSLTTNWHTRNYIVKVNGVVQTPVTNYIVAYGKLAFTSPIPVGRLITIEEHGGMRGYFIFTPSALTPGALIYRSRITGNLLGYLSITNTGKVFPVNYKIPLLENDRASLSLTTPSTYLGYQFYEYFLDNMQNYFAVVNKNYYAPLVKAAERKKRYYNYINYGSTITIYDKDTKTELYTSLKGLGVGEINGTVNIATSHIILEVVNYKVNFYSGSGELLKTVYLPDFPIQYEKYTYVSSGVTETDLLVLAANGTIYRIDKNLNTVALPKFTPAVRSNQFILDNLPINEDIPFQGTFTAAARKNLVTSLFPVVVGFAIYSTNVVYLIGSNSIAKVNVNTKTLIGQLNYPALEEFLNICPFDSFGVIVTTVNHRIFYVRDSGTITNLTPSSGLVLGTPCSMPFSRGGRVVVPDAHNRRLIVINSNLLSDITYINLGDFVPAYATRSGNTVYVTGHDTNRVIAIDVIDTGTYNLTETSGTRLTYYDFSQKVTLISALGPSMIAHHYLNNRTILDFVGTGIKKIVPVSFDYREGPSSSIGTDPRIIRLLGEDTVTPIVAPYINWWVNGSIKASVRDGEYLGINYRASVPGPHRSVIVLGETAIDYDTKTISSDSVFDYYSSSTNGTHLLPNSGFNINYVPPTEVIGEYFLPFAINFFGTTYSSFLLGTNGILSFDTTFPVSTIIPNFSNATADTLLIEPRELYVDRPINNSNVANVTWGSLSGGKTPGVYYTNGVIGEFAYYQFKFVGTTAASLPNGFNRRTADIAQSGTEINMDDITGIAINDYVSNIISSSGPPYADITSTGPVVGNPDCQVTAVGLYSSSASAYFTQGNAIFLTSSITPFKKYSSIASSIGQFLGYSNNILISDILLGNAVVKIDNVTKSIDVDGLINPSVNINYIFEVNLTTTTTVTQRGAAAPFYTTVLSSTSSSTSADIINATSITNIGNTFSPIFSRTASTLIQVSNSTFNTLSIGQFVSSSIFLTPEPIINKLVVSKIYNITITPKEGIEGVPGFIGPTVFTVDIDAGNVEDGTILTVNIIGDVTIGGPNSDFDYSVELIWPNTSRPNQAIDLAASFTLPIYGESARFTLTVRPDGITEGRENFTIRISGINPGSSDIMSLTAAIGRNITISGVTLQAPIVYDFYYIELANPYNTTTSTVLSTQSTRIVFASLPVLPIPGLTITNAAGVDGIFNTSDDTKTTVSITGSIQYKRFRLLTIDNISSGLGGTITTITASGKFITLTANQTLLPALTPMLFKTPTVHPAVEYQVGFYTGKNFQYIEYNYVGQPEHDNTLSIGLRNKSGVYVVSVPGTATGQYSHLFGSDSGSGLLISLGPGEFTHLPFGGFIPRSPRVFRERVFDNTTVRYDIYIDYKIPALNDVRASLDYGYLRVNDGYYDGTTKVAENDIFSVIVPFQQNRQVSAVIFSIGTEQIAIPVAPNSDIIDKEDNTIRLIGQGTILNLQSSFNITATGNYMIPDYFKNAGGLGGAELEFERWVSFLGNPAVFDRTLARGAYHELNQGDEIRVKNIFTGYRNFNTFEIVFAGVNITRFVVETSGAPDLVNYLNYQPLDKPLTYQSRSANLLVYNTPTVFLSAPGFETVANIGQINTNAVGSNFTETFNPEKPTPLYESRSLPLTVVSGLVNTQVNLYVDGSNVTFIVDGVRTGANYITANSGSLLGLEWQLYSYHAPNTKIWQITTDPIDSSTVYTEVGTWEIVNRELEVALINGIRNSGKSVKEIKLTSNGYGYLNETVSVSVSESPTGENATARAVLSSSGGEIIQILLINAGGGYVTAPTVTITGGNTLVAQAQAFLVDNLIPRENTLDIKMNYVQDGLTYGINEFVKPVFTLYSADTGPGSKLVYFWRNYSSFVSQISGKFDPYNHLLITGYIGQTGQIAESLFSAKIGQIFSQHPSVFMSTTQGRYGFHNLMFNKMPESKLTGYSLFTGNTLPAENVLKQATLFTGYASWAMTLAVTMFTSRNTGQFAGITMSTAPAPKMTWLPPETIFKKSLTYQEELPITLFYSKLDESFLTYFVIKSEPIEISWVESYLNVLGSIPNEQTRVIGTETTGKHDFEFSKNFEEYLESIGPRPTSITVTSFATLESRFVNISQPSPDAFPVTLLEFPTSVNDKTEEQFSEQPSLSNSSPQEWYQFYFNTLETLQEFTYVNIPILTVPKFETEKITVSDPLYVSLTFAQSESIPGIIKDLSVFYYKDNPVILQPLEVIDGRMSETYLEFPPKLETISAAFVDFSPEYMQESSVFYDFDAEYLQESIVPVAYTIELSHDQFLLIDFLPQIEQDKFLEIVFDPRILQNSMLEADLIPEIPDPGNRYIDFPPQLGDPGNRYIDFPPQLGDPGNRYIDFPPQLGDPGNRYIDFDPVLLQEEYLNITLSPDMGRNEVLVTMNWERDIPKNLYITLEPLLVQDGLEWYFDEFEQYGAHSTEFLVYADQGRAGDLGQYQGTAPGTPDRPRGPFLAYREFMGSALVSKIPHYGLGSFTSQAAAAAIAAKYVDAREFQIRGTDYWNYRIYFGRKTFHPRISKIWPRLWYIRGG